MRFRWMRQSSRAALIAAIVTRVTLRGMSIEDALDKSIPKYGYNPGSLSQLERKRILRDARAEMKRIEETRRSGTVSRRAGG